MTADRALRALRVLRLDYRPDLRQPEGLWEARCPVCAWCYDDRPLMIREAARGAPITVRCRHQCTKDSILVALAAALTPDALDQRIRRLELKLQNLERAA